jgi:putative endonuclease
MDGIDRGTLGARAEQFAFRYLLSRGLRPVARNFRTRRGELDLVMRDGDCLAFIEIRCRGRNSFVDAGHTVDQRKQRKLISCARAFLARNPAYSDWTCRFDIVGVDRDSSDRVRLQWLRDAFRA